MSRMLERTEHFRLVRPSGSNQWTIFNIKFRSLQVNNLNTILNIKFRSLHVNNLYTIFNIKF